MLSGFLEFVRRLREVSIPVSMVETLDAMACLHHVDLSDRAHLRAALGATLVKRAEHRAAFDALFDVYFASRRAESPRTDPGPGGGSLAQAPADGAQGGASDELLEALLVALRQNDRATLRALAALAVQRFGGVDAQPTGSARYHLYRVLRQLDLGNLLRRAMHEERGETSGRGGLTDRLARDEWSRRVEELRRLIGEEIRDRIVELRGPEAAARAYRPTLIEDVDFLAASPGELRAMREAIRPLARRLAARMARRRRFRRHGRLDVRRTMRRSLSAGGVPLEPAFRYRKVSRPDLYLLCDVSGSVAEFARFTMSLLYAMNDEFPRVRSFVFVDGIDEVTTVFDERPGVLDASQLLARANVVSGEGHSDYGRVFTRFWHVCGHAALGPRTTVIITGDARNNYRDPGVDALRAIGQRARRLYWLNPEPRREWDTTDSILGVYAPYCDAVVEARSLRQLAAFVDGIA